MPKETRQLKLQSWQFFAAARKHLGPQAVTAIFGKRNARTAYMWGQDPAYTVDRSRDPLEALWHVMSELDTIGRGDVARAAVAYLCSALEEMSDVCHAVQELQPTLHEELLADYGSVAELQRAIHDEASDIETVRRLIQEAKAEIDRTLAKYLMEHEQ